MLVWSCAGAVLWGLSKAFFVGFKKVGSWSIDTPLIWWGDGNQETKCLGQELQDWCPALHWCFAFPTMVVSLIQIDAGRRVSMKKRHVHLIKYRIRTDNIRYDSRICLKMLDVQKISTKLHEFSQQSQHKSFQPWIFPTKIVPLCVCLLLSLVCWQFAGRGQNRGWRACWQLTTGKAESWWGLYRYVHDYGSMW